MVNDLPSNCNNPKWDSFVSLFRYYNNKLKSIDMTVGRSTAGGGNYKSQLKSAKEILMDEYINKYYSDFKNNKSTRDYVSQTIGFNSYVMSFHLNNIGDKIKNDLLAASILAKNAFEKLTKSLKK